MKTSQTMTYCLLIGINGTVCRPSTQPSGAPVLAFCFQPMPELPRHRVLVKMEAARIVPRPELGSTISFIGHPIGFSQADFHLLVEPHWHSSFFPYVPEGFYQQLEPSDEFLYPEGHLRLLCTGTLHKGSRNVVKHKRKYLESVVSVQVGSEGKSFPWQFPLVCPEQNQAAVEALQGPEKSRIYLDGSVAVETVRTGPTEASQIVVYLNHLIPLGPEPSTEVTSPKPPKVSPTGKEPAGHREDPRKPDSLPPPLPQATQIPERTAGNPSWLGVSLTELMPGKRQPASEKKHAGGSESNLGDPFDDEFRGTIFYKLRGNNVLAQKLIVFTPNRSARL